MLDCLINLLFYYIYCHIVIYDDFLDEETRNKVYEQGMRGGGGVNESKREWGVGELEFEANMRMLDNAVSSYSLLAVFLICFAF